MSENGYVGLTLDDGPSSTTPQLLDSLAAAGLRATMFNQGNHSAARPDHVRAQREAGHWIANHTSTHPHLPRLTPDAVHAEIAGTQGILRDLTGLTPTLFRPPFGETDEQVGAVAARLGLLEVLWTVDSRDWAGASADEIVAAAATLEPGGIVLLHDWPPATIEAVPGIARVLRERNLSSGRIVPTSAAIPGAGTTFHAVAVRP